MPCLVRSAADGEIRKITLGHPLLDDYLAFVAARARANTWLAVAYDLKVFFEVVGKEPAAVRRADVFAYLAAREDSGVRANPVPRGLASRRPGRRGRGGVPLVRTPRTLPRVLAPAEVDTLLAALRTARDRAMVLAMLLGGLRRCEVLGLQLADVNAGERRLFIAEGKG